MPTKRDLTEPPVKESMEPTQAVTETPPKPDVRPVRRSPTPEERNAAAEAERRRKFGATWARRYGVPIPSAVDRPSATPEEIAKRDGAWEQ